MRGFMNMTILGRVVHDPEVNEYTDAKTGEVKVTLKFKVATNVWKSARNGEPGKEIGQFLQVRLWGKEAPYIARECKKGDIVGVSGRFFMDEYKDKVTGGYRNWPYLAADTIEMIRGPRKPHEEVVDDQGGATDGDDLPRGW